MLRVVPAIDGVTERWTIARPDAANAIDRATAEALESAIAAIEAGPLDACPRAIVLAALSREAGKRAVWCAGADLSELATVVDPRPFSTAMTARLARLAALPLVVIAAIAGDVYGGGCELLTACDLVVVERDVKIVFRQARMGLSTGWGGMTRLAARVGVGAARRLLLTGEPCDADEALRLGLVDRVVEPAGAVDAAVAWSQSIALGGRASIATLKRGLAASYASGSTIDEKYAAEVDRFVDAWSSGEHRAAMASRRAPDRAAAR